MADKIFINYRREDGAAYAARLFHDLEERFERDRLFIDIDTIAAGDRFPEAVRDAVGACAAMILIIGRRWLDAADEKGRPRIENPEDWVRTEISTALELGVRIIPVLVDGAIAPEASRI